MAYKHFIPFVFKLYDLKNDCTISVELHNSLDINTLKVAIK